MSTPENDRERRVDEAIAAYLQAQEKGPAPEREAFLAAHPDLRGELTSFLDDRAALLRRAPAGQPTVGASPAPPLGSVQYFGDYELLEEVARGGMGVVFRARQVSLNRVVALKMILAGALAGERDVARFRAEAEAVANLDHPNVCPVYEVGDHQGQQYYAMKFLPGGSLADRVASLKDRPREAAELLAKVADAVQHAHQRGILHRDLKPANVLLDEAGSPCVADFGLARRLGGDGGLTQTGAVVGTPAYAAPEQARAQKDLTTAADVYSLGAILYECLTGQPPFSGDSPLDVLRQVIDRAPAPPRQVNAAAPRDLETVALKCLEKEPARRYASAAAFADELRRWLDGRPIEARPAGAAERAWRWCRRNPVVAGLSAAVAVLLLTSSVAAAVAAVHFDALASAERQARVDAEDERRAAAAARQKAERSEREARWQLARQYVSRGWAELERGDVLASLPWYVEALALEDDDPKRAEIHRRRLGEILSYCPRIRHVLPHDDVYLARLSGDGKYVLTIERAGIVAAPGNVRRGQLNVDGDTETFGRFWGAHSGELLSGPWKTKGTREVSFSPDGRRVALTGGPRGLFKNEGCCEVRDVPSGRLLTTVKVKDYPCAVTWHPSGKSLLLQYLAWSTLAAEGRYVSGLAARSYDAATGKPLGPEISAGPSGSVGWARFSPDGKALATINDSGFDYDERDKYHLSRAMVEDRSQRHSLRERTAAHFRDPLTGAVVAALPHDDVVCLEFNPNGKTFVTEHRDGTARLWDLDSRKPISAWNKGGRAARLRWSDDGRHLLAEGEDRLRWLAPGGREFSVDLGTATKLAVGPGRRVLSRGKGGVRLWHPLAGDRHFLQATHQRLASTHAPDFAQLGPDGRTLLTVGYRPRVLLWDAGVRPCDRGALSLDRPAPTRYAVIQGEVVARSKEGFSTRYTVIEGGVVQVRDQSQDDELVGQVRLPAGGAKATLSADRKQLFVLRKRGDSGGELRVYDVPSFRERVGPVALEDLPLRVGERGLDCKVQEVTAGVLAVRRASDCFIVLPEEGARLGPFPSSLRFSSDGSTAAAVWTHGRRGERVVSCRAWSLPGMRPRFGPLRLAAATPFADDWALSPDGLRLALTIAGERRGRVIDLNTGEVVAELPAGVGPLQFLPDGRLLVRSQAGVRTWDVAAAEPLTLPMADFAPDEATADASHVLTGVIWHEARPTESSKSGERHRYGLSQPVSHDAQTGERITVPKAVGVTRRKAFPIETRSVEQLRLLASVLSGRRLDSRGAVAPLEDEEYTAAWKRLCKEMPEARRLTADEEHLWHADEASVTESWQDWKAAQTHLRWLAERSPEDGQLRRRWANALAELGRWADARRESSAAAERLTNRFGARVDAAWLSLACGDPARCRSEAKALLRDHAKTGSLHRARELLYLAAFAGDAASADAALAIYRRNDLHQQPWTALAEATAGRPRAALGVLKLGQKSGDAVEIDDLAAAVALKRAGEAKEAAAALARAKDPAAAGWRVRLAARLLRDELK